jgi:hypothetical protein
MQLAKMIGEIATKDARKPEDAPEKSAAKRGKARAAKLTAEQRAEIASKAAKTRWSRRK